jgi:hypothetical protein
MRDVRELLIPGLRIAWGAYWLAASRGVKREARRESVTSRAMDVVPLAIAAVFVGAHSMPGRRVGRRGRAGRQA